MATQTRDPTSYDTSSGSWDATTVSVINDYPDNSSTYLTHGTTAGDAAWNISAPTIPAGSKVNSVSVLYYRYKSGSTANMAGRLKIGSSYYNGTTSNLANNVVELDTETWTTNPATSAAWTVAGANGIAAIGVYSTDANPAIRVYSVRLSIDYNEAVTVALKTATATATGIGATPSAEGAAQSVEIDTAVATATPVALSVDAPIAPVTVALSTAVLWFASSRNRTVDLSAAQVTATPIPLVVIEDQYIALSSAILTVTGIPVTVSAPPPSVSVTLSTAVATAAGVPLTISAPGAAQTVTLDPATLTATGIKNYVVTGGTYETFEDVIGNWIVETDTSGTGSTVERSDEQEYAGSYSAKCFTTNTSAKAQVRDIISSPWSGVSADTNSYVWQRAYIYVPTATSGAITGAEYLDLAALYVSSDASGWYLRLMEGAQLYGVGPGSAGQVAFKLWGTLPLDEWVEVEIGLWSRASGDLDRAGCFLVNGTFYGWFTNGEAETDYDRAAMGIVATNSTDDLTVYVDNWYIYTTGSAPVGTDNRPTTDSYTKDYTTQSGANVGYHYTTWENGYTYNATYGMTPTGRLQFGPEHSLMPDLSDGWTQIVMDWNGGNTPSWPPDNGNGNFFFPMVAFRKSVELEENLEIVPVYRPGGSPTVDLVYESWTIGASEYAEWELPVDTTSGQRIPGRGDIIRVKWQEVSATEIRVRVDYYDASADTWYTDVIDDTRALNNVSGVNFLADTHRTVTSTIDSNDYTIKSQTFGVLTSFPPLLDAASMTVTGIPLTVSAPAPGIDIPLDTASITATGIALAIDAPITRTLDTAAATATPIPLSVDAPITRSLTTASLIATPIPLTVDAPVTVSLSTATLTGTGVAISVDAPVSRTLDTASLTATGIPLTVSAIPPGLVVTLSTGQVAATGIPLSIDAPVTLSLDTVALTATPIPLSIDAPITRTLDTAALVATPVPLTVSTVAPGQTVILDPASITAAPIAFDVVPGAKSIALSTASTTAAGIGIAVSVGGAPQSVSVNTASIAATGIPFQINQTVDLDTGTVTAAGIALSVFLGTLYVSLDTISIAATGIGITIEGGEPTPTPHWRPKPNRTGYDRHLDRVANYYDTLRGKRR